MKKRPLRLLALTFSLLGVLFASPAIASEVVYSTFGPGQSYNTASGWPVGTLPFFFDEAQGMEAAVSFTPSRDYMVDYIDVAALLDPISVSNLFTVTLFRDSGPNLPGTAMETFLFTGAAETPAVYSASSLLHPQLTAAEKYWLVMSSDELLNIYLTWLDTDTFLDVEIAYRNALYTDWVYGYGAAPAVEVRGTTAVAEPCSMFLLGLGLVALAAEKRRTDG